MTLVPEQRGANAAPGGELAAGPDGFAGAGAGSAGQANGIGTPGPSRGRPTKGRANAMLFDQDGAYPGGPL